jgi:hypothetical protein
MGRIASSPALRNELGQKGYEAFCKWWCREAHLEQYFGYLERNARKKFGKVPWQEP